MIETYLKNKQIAYEWHGDWLIFVNHKTVYKVRPIKRGYECISGDGKSLRNFTATFDELVKIIEGRG